MIRYLITGGVGFIGSHLIKALLREGVRITVADRRSRDESPILGNGLEGVDFVKIDLRRSQETAKLVAEVRPDVVYHLAAQPLSIASNINPLDTARDNILGTYSVLEGVRSQAPHSRVVYSSSACFYGVPTSEPPLREMDPPAVGHYMYTATKIAADFAMQHYRHIYHLDCVCSRMVNVYGPGDIHLDRIVPRLIRQALLGEAPSLTQSDGSDVLSYLYVDDAVAALCLLGTHPHAAKRAVWNIAGAPPISVLELMRKIYGLVGRPTQPFAAIGHRRDEPVHKYLDGTMIREELGFSSSIDLNRGLKSTIDWYELYLETACVVEGEIRNVRRKQ